MANPFSNSDGPFQNSSPTETPIASKPATNPTETPSVGDIFAANAAMSGVVRPNGAHEATSGTTATQPTDGESLKLPPVPKYKPSGGIGVGTWPLLCVFLPLTAVLVGFIHQYLTNGGGPLFLTQMGMGLVTGLGACVAIRLGKCRNVGVAATAGLLAAILTYGASFGMLMAKDRAMFIDAFAPTMAAGKKMTLDQARQTMTAKMPLTSFAPMWLRMRAASGVTLRSTRSSSSLNGSSGGSPTFSGNGWYIFELVKMGFAALIAACVAGSVAGARYSEEHNNWYKTKGLYQLHPGDMYDLVNAAVKEDWRSVGEIGKASKTGGNIGGTVQLLQVPGQTNGIVQLRSQNGQNSEVIFEKEVTSEDMKAIRLQA